MDNGMLGLVDQGAEGPCERQPSLQQAGELARQRYDVGRGQFTAEPALLAGIAFILHFGDVQWGKTLQTQLLPNLARRIAFKGALLGFTIGLQGFKLEQGHGWWAFWLSGVALSGFVMWPIYQV